MLLCTEKFNEDLFMQEAVSSLLWHNAIVSAVCSLLQGK